MKTPLSPSSPAKASSSPVVSSQHPPLDTPVSASLDVHPSLSSGMVDASAHDSSAYGSTRAPRQSPKNNMLGPSSSSCSGIHGGESTTPPKPSSSDQHTTLEDLQRRMGDTLLHHQQQQQHTKSTCNHSTSYSPRRSDFHPETSSPPASKTKRGIGTTSDNPLTLPNSSLAAGLKSPPAEPPHRSSPHSNDASAYPFPPEQQQPSGVSDPRSPTFHRTPRTEFPSMNGTLAADASRESSPRGSFDPGGPGANAVDAKFQSPNLYDITLRLNADPGLDAWWTNVVQVLQTHYGADRATLAVPGDATDLENVPWGQKATFSRDGGDAMCKPESDTTARRASFAADMDVNDPNSASDLARATSAKRPKLMGRHSFAGDVKHAVDSPTGRSEAESNNTRPYDPHRRRSSAGTTEKQRKASRASARTKSDPQEHKNGNKSPTTPSASLPAVSDDTSEDAFPSGTLGVFPVPRALEVEPDPLIKRTGVVKLFGRTTPVILTREYTNDPTSPARAVHQPKDKVQRTPRTQKNTRPESQQDKCASAAAQQPSTVGDKATGADDERRGSRPTHSPERYGEYEQMTPSPWSQSPAPSPAPLRNPEENPFFRNLEVNEQAFASNPPPYDYSKDKLLEAIGTDQSKSIIHVPLLHSPVSKKASQSTLRFPVAVLSFSSPIVPYPSNWTSSLAHLLPHLTTSYGLASHYSQLERHLSSTTTSRYGHILGLGGTFSDASSELELVAGLSGHVNHPPADDNVLPGNPANTPGITRSSSVRSIGGVLGSDISNIGSRSETLFGQGSASPRQGSDPADYYFKPKQAPSGHPHHRNKSIKVSSDGSPSMPTSPQSRKEDEAAYDEWTSRDPGLVPTPYSPETGNQQQQQHQQPQPQSQSQYHQQQQQQQQHPPGVSRHSSTASIATTLHREQAPSRPFPDTIAQLMLNSVPLHLFLAKPQTGEVIWTNSKFDAYRRSQPQEPRVRDPWQNVHESEREVLQSEWSRALKTGAQITERVRVKRFNDEGAYRWFIFRANPLLSGAGELLYWIGSFLDVHEQHVSEMKAAREREVFATDAKYRALANSIPQIVFEAAEFRGLISANEQWQIYTGQSLEEAQNFGFAKYIHRDDLEKCGILSPPMALPDAVGVPEFSHIVTNSITVPDLPSESDEQSSPGPQTTTTAGSTSTATPTPSKEDMQEDTCGPFGYGVTPALQVLVAQGVVIKQRDENGRDSYTTEIRFRSRGGEFRWHLVRLVKVENPFGSGEASWYGTCTDINDRKILESQLNAAMHKLNKEMESKTNFFRNMSHELRTPLTGILGTIPFILETHLDNDQRRMLDTVQNSSTNLRELVDNILDVSRVEAGKMNIVHQWFHVRSLLEDVMDTIGSRAIDKGLELNYLVNIDVPDMVMGDRFRVRQVLINLVGNAVKFTSQGEIYTRCSLLDDPSIPLESSEILLNFEVVDTGKGFSSTDAERLMQRFSQIEGNGSQQHAGSGLGLFLSKQLVEMHGGRLTPTSKEGRGAKFSFFVKIGANPPSPTPMAKRRLNGSNLPVLRTEGQHRGVVKQELVESPSQDSPGQSSLALPDNSSRSDSSFASASSVVSPNLVTSFPSTASSSSPKSEKNGEQQDTQLGLATASSTATTTTPQDQQDQSAAVDCPREYTVLVICPFDYAREAIQQHIEQIIPLGVSSKVTSVLDVEDWKDLVNSGDCASLTHVVVCWPESKDVLFIMEHVLRPDTHCSPTLVVVADMYLKREISQRYGAMIKADKKVAMVPKPVKPSAFARIFDPMNERDLSKDRNQDMARELNNSFKTMSRLVKEVIGNKGYRVLLVEDDETNRTVMLKYLEKVKLASDTAANGQQCVDMVFSKEPGYYSLIICDIQMPVKNGYETCREIRQWEQRNHFPEIPIMALSANAMMDQIDDAARAGFNDYVTKPIKHNELGKMMMELLDPSSPRVMLKDRNRKC